MENGKFVLDFSDDRVEESTQEMYREGVEKFNSAIESGSFRLKKTDDQAASTTQSTTFAQSEQSAVEQTSQFILLPTGDSDLSSETTDFTVSAASCNRSDVTIRSADTFVPGETFVNIYLSDGDIADISALAPLGGVSGKLFYDYLVRKGLLAAGALAGPAATAITVAVVAEWAIIQYQNNGCGVEIKTGYSPVNPTYQVPTVSSQ